MNGNSPDWPIAAHEAGHCVAAAFYGWPVVLLSLDERVTRVDRPPVIVSRQLCESLAVVRMAGIASEALTIRARPEGIDFEEQHHGQGDMQVAASLAQTVYPGDDQEEERDQFCEKAVRRGFDVVEQHRQLILDLATALLERREMDRDAIERVLLASLANEKENA